MDKQQSHSKLDQADKIPLAEVVPTKEEIKLFTVNILDPAIITPNARAGVDLLQVNEERRRDALAELLDKALVQDNKKIEPVPQKGEAGETVEADGDEAVEFLSYPVKKQNLAEQQQSKEEFSTEDVLTTIIFEPF